MYAPSLPSFFTGKPQPYAVDDARWHYLMLHSWCRKVYWSCFMLVWRVPLLIVLYRYNNFFLLCEGAANVHVNMVYCCLVKGTGPTAVYCTLYCSSPLVHSNSLKDCELNLMLAFRGSCSDVYIKCKYTTSPF